MRNSTSVGLLIPVDVFRARRKDTSSIEEFFLRTCCSLPVLDRLLRHATFIPGSMSVAKDYSYRTVRQAGPGFYLIGDAAGFIDPIFSIGVVLAMYGARSAAWAIDRSLRQPGRAAEYQALFESQLKGRIELSRQLAAPVPAGQRGGIEQSQLMMRFFGRRAQALMNAVTSLTGRESNFQALIDDDLLRTDSRARIHAVAAQDLIA
jgi:flavin-dependent dehydrogenase